MLKQSEREFLIDLLSRDLDIPEDYKKKLFPIKNAEYELSYAGKMRKEDIIANDDFVYPVPIQIERVFNGDEYKGFDDGWKNLLVFGDNLQFLKTIYEDDDPLIKNRIKGKVKLIYIDPPFGTGDEYDGNKGQSAYSAKRKGADFVEFIRRRLILAKEILSDDGVIFVRQGYNFGHYIKIVLDEVFGKNNLINEIVVNRGKQRFGGSKKFITATDTVFLYSKSQTYTFNSFTRERYEGEAGTTNMLMKGHRNPPERVFQDECGNKITLLPPVGQHWKFKQAKIDELYRKELMYLAESRTVSVDGIRILKEDGKVEPFGFSPSFYFDDDKTIDSNWTDISGYSQLTGYPTENSESLLERVISSASNEGDIIMDFFGGSGTTAVVAEKLKRKWITCDIGKLSFFTIQKRILQIQNGKSLTAPGKKYGEKASSFITCSLGNYDLGTTLKLEFSNFKQFVSKLFVFDLEPHTINGFEFDGKKDGYSVKVFDFTRFSQSNIDDKYLSLVSEKISSKISGSRIYLVSPANRVQFVSDYVELNQNRYYFLKIPYQVIKELHQMPFHKYRQPQSKDNVNALDDAIGFSFVRSPEVVSRVVKNDNKYELIISKFASKEKISNRSNEEKTKDDFDLLSAVFVDSNYNNDTFVLTESFFLSDIKKNEKAELVLSLGSVKEKSKIMIVYTDIYGNDLTEIIELK